ncbi:doublecortin domain-containing protein 2C [Erythrolamprus reginae]|uniref:doublecortin domain-containing protein 2C n=1 Tax=Erythrolamprus reginae TaxID=121349 RepID=UPI00396C7E3B
MPEDRLIEDRFTKPYLTRCNSTVRKKHRSIKNGCVLYAECWAAVSWVGAVPKVPGSPRLGAGGSALGISGARGSCFVVASPQDAARHLQLFFEAFEVATANDSRPGKRFASAKLLCCSPRRFSPLISGRPRAMPSLTDSTPARTVWVYRNGDPFYLGRKFIINPRYVPTFEAFMIQLNEGVPTPFGVRKLYTPTQGHIVADLPELQQGGRYVVAGRERFRKINYSDIGAKKPQRKKRDAVIRPVVHSNIKVPSKWQSAYNKPRNINVFTNGNLFLPPMKIIIPRFTLKNWNGVLAVVNEKVFPRSGGIHRLFTLKGQRIHGPDQLEDNQFYVACGKERFQHLPYWHHSKVPENIRRNFLNSLEPSEKPPMKKLPIEAPKQRDRIVTPIEASRQGGGDRPSVYYAKSDKASQETQATRPVSPNDVRSVYIAHQSPTEIEGAREIQEDKDVKVEIPIDQVPAEIIQDEEIYADPGSIKEQAPSEIVQDQTIDAKNIEEQAKEGEQLQEKKGAFKRVFGFFFSRSKKDIKENGEEQDRKKQMDYTPENDYWDAYGYD